MSDNDKPLSYNEMWDDSMLVDSWNQALEEYKVSKGDVAAERAKPSRLTRPRNTTAYTPRAFR